jgi:hypothetical protein
VQFTLSAIFGKTTFENVRLPRTKSDKVEVIKKGFKLLVEQSQSNKAKLKETGYLIEIKSNNKSFASLSKDLILERLFSRTIK